MAAPPRMQSSDSTLFLHFKYGLLQFLTKQFGASAIRSYAETGFMKENTSFQESVGDQKPIYLMYPPQVRC